MTEDTTRIDDDGDEEALAWAGDEKPKRVEAAPVVETIDATTPAEEIRSMPAPLLVTYGILAGIYLIYTFGWIYSVLQSTLTFADLLAEIMFQLGEFLAIASPALWFVAVLLLTRGRKPIVRLLLLLIGLVATVPWPFVLGG